MSRGRRSRDRGYISGNRIISAPTYDEVSVNYLVVAGGGGGGKGTGAGGGAGGLRSTITGTGGSGSLESALTLFTGISYTVTVGSGGAGGTSGQGTVGVDSVFSSVTSVGGGGGGSGGSGGGGTGGSGGGGGPAGTGGVQTVNQGFAGGGGSPTSVGAGVAASGGGGGAGGVGGTAVNGTAGSGGSGVAVSITGSSITYAGGGAGSIYSGDGNLGAVGSSGSGGGGTASLNAAGGAGSTNLGGGGGGGALTNATNYNGGAGGSGVVILRYSNLYTLSIGAGLSYSTQVLNDDKVTTFTGGSGSISLSPAPVTTGDYESIATVLVDSAGASSFTFSNIPQTYKHLQLRIIARTTFNSHDDYLSMRFNGDSGANYTSHGLYAEGTTPGAYGAGNQTILSLQRVAGASAPANTFGIVIADILDYTNTNKFKTFKNLGGVENNTQGAVYLHSGVWQNTAAITSVQIFGGNSSSTLVQNTRLALYGIKG